MTAQLLGRWIEPTAEAQPTRGSPGPRLAFRPAAGSGRGPRPDNQDAGCAGERLLAVADGVGGAAGGGIAAALVISHLVRHPAASGGGLDGWRKTVLSADARVRAAARLRSELAGLATTLTAVALGPRSDAFVVHIGDSRAYLQRDGVLQRLTTDTTFVQGLLDAGILTEERARTHPLRSVLLAALRGEDDDARALQATVLAVRPGDRLLLCTDGLTGSVSDGRLGAVLVEEPDPAAAVQRLLRTALAASTHDNVTAVVGDVVVPGGSPDRTTVQLVGAATLPPPDVATGG